VTSSVLRNFSGQNVFLYSAIARPGNSGGPIISLTGNVVGMVTEELKEETDDPASSFYAGIPASEIAAAVSELGVAVTLPIEDYK
jgi:S1-C subfamily serine protease